MVEERRVERGRRREKEKERGRKVGRVGKGRVGGSG